VERVRVLGLAVAALLLAAGCASTPRSPAAQPTGTTPYPPGATVPAAPACRFPDHIYRPSRLRLLGCRTVTGRVTAVRSEPDGDYHARLALDPPYAGLLTAANVRYQAGTLVVEEPCQHAVTQDSAEQACAGYRSPWPRLTVGRRYRLTGNYVLDREHHDWAELHGLAEVTVLS